MRLKNYVSGKWQEGGGDGTPLVNPTTGEEVARAGADGIDLKAGLEFAREQGSAALHSMSYGERAAMIRGVADVLTENREKYYDIAQKNSGNTAPEAGMDIDGGIGTLKYYSAIGKGLGDATYLVEDGVDQLTKEEAFKAAHIWTPIKGVAIHINAFNFPSWGLWEKASVAWLSGVPVFAKPATATSWLSNEMVKDVIEAGAVPEGALSIICGGGRELMDFVTGQDAVAFTGSADTAHKLKSNSNVIAQNTRFTVEADSLNLSLLGEDVTPGSAEFDLYVREVVREMTFKAGQKCTAIRRILVPRAVADDVTDAIKAKLESTQVGNPGAEGVRMGPLVNKAQQEAALQGLKKLSDEAKIVTGGGVPKEVTDADADKGCFVAPTLLRHDEPVKGEAIHEIEVFGPAATVMPYSDKDQAFALAALGQGSLAASVFTADDAFANEASVALGPTHGRVLVVNEAIGKMHTGHGVVMPQCVHGGPGRAGGGEEQGGFRGLRFYHQRSAVQASADRLDALKEKGAAVTL